MNLLLYRKGLGCVTNVDSYSLYASTYVAGVRYISKIVCYHQVLFAAVTQLQHFEVKTTNIFAASEFHIIANIHLYSILSMCAYVTGTLPVYTVCSQFNHYVGLVNVPHASTCPMFPYVESNRVFFIFETIYSI